MRHRGLRAGGRTHPAKGSLRPESVRPGRRVPRGKAVAASRGHGQRPTRAVRGRGGARRRGAKRFHRMNRRAACRRVLRAVPGNAKDRGRGRTTAAPGSGPGRPGARAARSERSRTRGGGPRPLGGRLRLGTREAAGRRRLPGGGRGQPGMAPAAGPGRDPASGRSRRPGGGRGHPGMAPAAGPGRDPASGRSRRPGGGRGQPGMAPAAGPDRDPASGRSLRPGGGRGHPGMALAAGPGRDPASGRSRRPLPGQVRAKTPPPTASRSASLRPEWVPGE